MQAPGSFDRVADTLLGEIVGIHQVVDVRYMLLVRKGHRRVSIGMHSSASSSIVHGGTGGGTCLGHVIRSMLGETPPPHSLHGIETSPHPRPLVRVCCFPGFVSMPVVDPIIS